MRITAPQAPTRRSLIFGLTLGPALAVWAAPAADFWDSKQPSEWSEKDVQRLLTKSPWAKETSTEMDFGEMGGRGFGGPGMGPPPGMGGGPGGPGGPGGSAAVVRWESAAPIRDANKSKLPGGVSSSYIVSISGVPMLSDLAASMGESGMDTLKKATSLQRTGKKPLTPTHISMAFDQAGVMLFYFPADDEPISADEKQVIFQTKVEMITLKAKFNPKEMIYRGKLAL